MDNNLLKYLIAFSVGIIIYKIILNRCSCDIIEGQCLEGEGGGECIKNIDLDSIQSNLVEDTIITCSGADNEFCGRCIPGGLHDDQEECRCCMWSGTNNNNNSVLNQEPTPSSLNSVINNLNTYYTNENQLQTLLNNFASVSGTDTNENILENIPNLSDIGDPVNSETLDYIELIIRNTLNIDNDTLKQRIASTFYDSQDPNQICINDINLNIMGFMILIYNNTVDKNEFVNVINISNRISKYVPDILDKIQEIYEDCPKQSNYYKSQILMNMYNRLFKNNTTVINVKGFSNLMKSLENVKTIYIVLFMICFTYIIVKFMGMFSMKLNM